MTNFFNYENNLIGRKLKFLFIYVISMQILGLAFFSIIGQYANDDANDILSNELGIVSLASTLTIATISIYMVVVLNSYIVEKFIGTAKERIYLFPQGKEKILRNKLLAFIKKYLLVTIEFMVATTIIYHICSTFVFKIFNNVDIFENIVELIGLVLLSVFVSLLIILLSTMIGIICQSTNISIIAAVIFVCLIGNLIANSYLLNIYILLGLISIMIVTVTIITNVIIRKVKSDNLWV